MDLLSIEWLHELEMEGSNLICQSQMDSAGDHSLDEFIFKCLSPEVYSSSSNTSLNDESMLIETSKQIMAQELKQSSIGNSHTAHNMTPANSSSLSNNVISFGQSRSPSSLSQQIHGNTDCIGKPNKDDELMYQENVNLSLLDSQSSEENLNENDSSESCKRAIRVGTRRSREPLHAQNHILAERMRREKLNQKLISLSALIPGLKKMDKASILEDAIKYIKQLQEREQTLEKGYQRKLVEPTAFSAKRSRSSIDDDAVSSEDNFNVNFKRLSPEIEARLSDNNVLVRIHCEKRRGGVLPKILNQMQAVHLNVTSSFVVPFGNAALDITILAQMDSGFHMTAKDLVENLRLAAAVNF